VIVSRAEALNNRLAGRLRLPLIGGSALAAWASLAWRL
jgi:hypothetical protein